MSKNNTIMNLAISRMIETKEDENMTISEKMEKDTEFSDSENEKTLLKQIWKRIEKSLVQKGPDNLYSKTIHTNSHRGNRRRGTTFTALFIDSPLSVAMVVAVVSSTHTYSTCG